MNAPLYEAIQCTHYIAVSFGKVTNFGRGTTTYIPIKIKYGAVISRYKRPTKLKSESKAEITISIIFPGVPQGSILRPVGDDNTKRN